MGFLKVFAVSIWANHRKKFIAFVLGVLFAILAAVSGIPLQEIKDAAKDAAGAPAPVIELAPVKIEAPAK